MRCFYLRYKKDVQTMCNALLNLDPSQRPAIDEVTMCVGCVTYYVHHLERMGWCPYSSAYVMLRMDRR